MVDVSDFTPAKIKKAVKEVVGQAADTVDARDMLRKRFPSAGIVWVRSLGNFQWEVQLQPLSGSEVYTFKCNRRP